MKTIFRGVAKSTIVVELQRQEREGAEAEIERGRLFVWFRVGLLAIAIDRPQIQFLGPGNLIVEVTPLDALIA